MCTNKGPRVAGIITIFLSLSLLMVLSVLFTLLESARSEALRLRAQMIANSSIESAFASYDKHLFEKYGLLLFAGRDSYGEELSGIALDYAKKNTDESLVNNNWLNLSSEKVNVLNLVLATDRGGDVFIRSVCDYMEEAGLLESVVSLAGDAFSSDEMDVATNSDGEIDLDTVKKSVANNEDAISSSEEDEENASTVENKEELEKKYNESKTNLKNWANRGILALVCGDATSISDMNYDFDAAPSAISDERKERSVADIEEVSATDLLIFDQYVMDNLNSYMKDSDGRLEIEYVIAGKSNNISNLSSIAKRIVAIRFGLDYVKIRGDAAKVSEAYAIGVAIAGWTGIPSLVTAVKESVLVIWALGDAIGDAKEIFAGERDDKGLSYTDYLRGFLLLKSSGDKAYRAMDVIQWNVTTEEAAFRFTNCVYAARINLETTSTRLFPLLPAPITYSFNTESAYAYGKVNNYK